MADSSSNPPEVRKLPYRSWRDDVSVGWRRFAVSADVAKAKSADSAVGGRETAVLGVSYSLSNRLSTRVAVGAERTTGNPVPGHGNFDTPPMVYHGPYVYGEFGAKDNCTQIEKGEGTAAAAAH